MVARTFVAFDNENLVVASSSAGGIVGNGVINNSSTPNGTIFDYAGGSGQTITLDDTGGSADTFEDDQSASHTITDGGGLVANGQAVEAESIILVRALDAGGNPTGPVITLTVFSQGGITGDVWGLSSDIPLQDGTSYIKTGGSNTGSSDYNTFVTCFTAGTIIDTPDGPRLIEALTADDLVLTRDSGPLPIRWIGSRSVAGIGAFAPVRFAVGAVGNTAPIAVSPEHRMMLQDPTLELLFGTPRALVAAKHLIGLPGISQENVAQVTYYHLMFDTHQIISASGCWSESFFLADNALAGLHGDAHREIRALFPCITAGKATFGGTAEMELKAHEAMLFKAVLERTPLPIAA